MSHPSGASSLDMTNWGAQVVKPRRPIICKTCHAHITDMDFLLSRSFTGFCGKAALFASISSTGIILAPPTARLMYTGAHTIQELACRRCRGYLGWKILRAHEWSEKWKDGRFLLELAALTGHELWDEETAQKRQRRRRRTTIIAPSPEEGKRNTMRPRLPDSPTPSP
ncbi:yippee-domain-containing protein [Neolentinus lepideus HHB14362 ss-1]|uniref:Yippee-domain-containing protein n=1 Tax=Neolentinus lepideus HHB14362 ss-1 TaxID=1314782 RepID=A0A165RKK5_9AGAM|nr:yippee-domain-containing protein [Neolentinus lepideus HHB14362 ss-1]